MASEQSRAVREHYRRSNAVAAMNPPLSLTQMPDLDEHWGDVAGIDRKDPLVSPLYAYLCNPPSAYVQAGGAEMLVDDARRFAERARAAGVKVELEVFEDQQHTFQMMAGRAPEADEAIARLSTWVRPHLGLDKVRP